MHSVSAWLNVNKMKYMMLHFWYLMQPRAQNRFMLDSMKVLGARKPFNNCQTFFSIRQSFCLSISYCFLPIFGQRICQQFRK